MNNKDILNIASIESQYKLKKGENRKINVYGILNNGFSIIEPKHLIYSILKEYKKAITISKEGIITGIDKCNGTYVRISLKNRPQCYCAIFVEVK